MKRQLWLAVIIFYWGSINHPVHVLCMHQKAIEVLTPQEPGANASEIYSVLKHVRPGDDFVPNFEMFAKSDVNGKDQNPIYEFLKSRCPSVRAEFQASYKLYYEPYHQDDIRWNFEKFLVNHQGQPVRRYDESLDPSELVPDIDVLLGKCEQDLAS